MSRVVNLTGPAPWGFRISGGRDFKKPITVSKVNDGSKAEKADLRSGDVILAINDDSTADMLNVEAQNKIKTSPSRLRLTVRRSESDVSHQTNGLPSPDLLATRFQTSLNTGRGENQSYEEYSYLRPDPLSPKPTSPYTPKSPIVYHSIPYTPTSPSPLQSRPYSPVSPSVLQSNSYSSPRLVAASHTGERKAEPAVNSKSFQYSPRSQKPNNTDYSYFQHGKTQIQAETPRPRTPTKMTEQERVRPVSSPKVDRETTGSDIRRSASPVLSPNSYSKSHSAASYSIYSPRSPRESSSSPQSPVESRASPSISSWARQSSLDPDADMKRFEQESEVYKMLQENREAKVAPRQSNTFRMLQEVLETDEKEAAARFPGRLSTNAPKAVASVAGVQKYHICEKCNTSIVMQAVKIQENCYRHPECYVCTDCGLNLKMRGHFWVRDVMYCEKHARERYRGPEGTMVSAVYSES